MVIAGNTTDDNLWCTQINLSAPKRSPTAVGEELAAELARQREAEIDKFSDVQVFPNPFWSAATSRFAGNSTTTIRFAVKEPATVKLLIFNLRGELVRTLADGEFSRGLYEKIKRRGLHSLTLSRPRLLYSAKK